MKPAEQILDEHLSRLISANPDDYDELPILKEGPEYQDVISAMGEYGKETYNQAIDDAAERAYRFIAFYNNEETAVAIKDSILKLKKK